MRRRHAVTVCAVILTATLAGVACSGGDDPPIGSPKAIEPGDPAAAAPATSEARTAPSSQATVAPSPTTIVADSTVADSMLAPSVDERAAALCAGTTRVVGRLASPMIDEASGLVASRTHDDVLWVHNDGAETAGVFAVSSTGADLGFHPLPIDDVSDIEDIALVAGADGDDLLLADIGDNAVDRATIRLYRVPEPDPASPAAVSDVEVLEFAYPDGPHNAEVLLVDDRAGTIVIVTKELRASDDPTRDLVTDTSFVYEGALDDPGEGPRLLVAAGTLDTLRLETLVAAPVAHPSSLLGFGGVPTGGDVTSDGGVVAIRTYETVWVWPRPEGVRLADVFAGQPCQVPLRFEPQGEAIGFDGDELVSISEGSGALVNRVVP